MIIRSRRLTTNDHQELESESNVRTPTSYLNLIVLILINLYMYIMYYFFLNMFCWHFFYVTPINFKNISCSIRHNTGIKRTVDRTHNEDMQADIK